MVTIKLLKTNGKSEKHRWGLKTLRNRLPCAAWLFPLPAKLEGRLPHNPKSVKTFQFDFGCAKIRFRFAKCNIEKLCKNNTWFFEDHY